MIRDTRAVLRRMLVLSRVVLTGFSAESGEQRNADATRTLFTRWGLDDEVYPQERAFLFGASPTYRQVTDATWRSEALVALHWAVGDASRLPVGGPPPA